MAKKEFDSLVKGVKDMRRHMAGKRVRGVRTMRVVVADVQAIRKSVNISQARSERTAFYANSTQQMTAPATVMLMPHAKS